MSFTHLVSYKIISKAMGRKMLNVKPKDKKHSTIIRQRTRMADLGKYVTKTGNGLDTSSE